MSALSNIFCITDDCVKGVSYDDDSAALYSYAEHLREFQLLVHFNFSVKVKFHILTVLCLS